MTNLLHSQASVQVSDGTEMNLYVSRPDTNEKLPAVMVFQEAFGVNSHIRDVTDRIAAEGYLAVAPELFHRTAPGFEGEYGNFDAVRPHTSAITISGLEADINATYEYLKQYTGNIASVGFCMGGRVSILAGMTVKLNAAVSFYGGHIVETIADRLEDVSCPLMMFWGGLDKHIPESAIDLIADKLQEADKDFASIYFSKADHGFFCDQRASYNPSAAKASWGMVKAFFEDKLRE